MTRQQEFLIRACTYYNLNICIDHELILPSGARVKAKAYIPDLGPSNGMLVFSSFDQVNGCENELINNAYGYSVYDAPSPTEEFDLKSYTDMFVDWNGEPLAMNKK